MNESWTAHRLADELMRLMPSLGRLMSLFIRDSGEEETTMMQVTGLFHIQKDPITVSELAKKRRVSLQAASVFVQGLVERGWVTRTPDPNDRRQFILQLTPEGLDRAEKTRSQMSDYLTGFLSHLSAEEIAAASVFLPALNQLLITQMEADLPKNEKQDSIPEEQTNL